MLKAWSRPLWGICFTDKDGRQSLIGEGWAAHRLVGAPDAPLRALLFCNRSAARDWCRDKMQKWTGDEVTANWRVRPVRVVESVTPATEPTP